MSTKRKWDQAEPDSPPSKSQKVEDGKMANEAAAAAAAIAAEIAAQFAGGGTIPTQMVIYFRTLIFIIT